MNIGILVQYIALHNIKTKNKVVIIIIIKVQVNVFNYFEITANTDIAIEKLVALCNLFMDSEYLLIYGQYGR